MQFTNNLAVAASFIAAVTGATLSFNVHSRQNSGTTNSIAPAAIPAYFQLMALRSASPVHFSRFQAAKGSIFLQLPNQNATCDEPEVNDAATFYLTRDGGLHLYAAADTPQQLYADLSSMGQGKLGYTTGRQAAPANSETTGFTIDQYGDLTLEGAGFLACPNSLEDSWSVWISAGINNPAGNTNCLGVSIRAVEVAKPNNCVYTS
ncbi:hypothetical protein EsH8_II_001577 [Colletotrichum jinshuiense]